MAADAKRRATVTRLESTDDTHSNKFVFSRILLPRPLHTPCSCSRGVCAAKRVPTTRVTPVRPTEAAPASCKATGGHGTVGMQGPNAHTGAVQEWDATPAGKFARAGVQRRPTLECVQNAAGARSWRQLLGSGHATHTAMASAALSSHSHPHARAGFISVAVGRRRTRAQACDEKTVLNLHRWM